MMHFIQELSVRINSIYLKYTFFCNAMHVSESLLINDQCMQTVVHNLNSV